MAVNMPILTILCVLWFITLIVYVLAVFGQHKWKISPKHVEKLSEFVRLLLTAILGFVGGGAV